MADYTRYEPGTDEGSLRPALWCLRCVEPNYGEDPRVIWVAPEGQNDATLADLMAVADEHEAKHHADPTAG